MANAIDESRELRILDAEAFDPDGPIYTSPHMAARRASARDQFKRAQAAIDTVARYIVARSYGGPAAMVIEIDWSDYPEIGEHDWQAVLDRANELVTDMRPDEETYQQAYRLLADQADEEVGYR